MVNVRRVGVFALICLGAHNSTSGESAILSVRVASEDKIRIKPCEPVFLLLDVSVREFADAAAIKKIPNELARRVLVNQSEYSATFSSTPVNPVAGFFVDDVWLRSLDDIPASLPIVVLLYWNYEEQDYVFSEPGRYRVRFDPGGQVTVVVEKPEDAEWEIVSEIGKLGVAFAMFVMNSGDHRAREFASTAERMLKNCGDTTYAQHLALPLGMVKLRKARADAVDILDLIREEATIARTYFEPHCNGELKSMFQAVACYELAQRQLALIRRDPEVSAEEAVRIRREARTLLQKVSSSPFSLDYARKAATALDELNE